MSRIQSRKSISLNGVLYWRFKERCAAIGRPMSQVVEEAVIEFLDKEQPLHSRLATIAKQAHAMQRLPETEAEIATRLHLGKP